jgi:hypothetical protein
VEDAPIEVALIDAKSLVPKPSAPAAKAPKAVKKPKPVKPPPRRNLVRRSPARPDRDSLTAGKVRASDTGDELTEAQIAGAAEAGSGSGEAGGICDMARRVQTALRKDPLVLAAVAASSGKAMMVWNGDWVRGRGEDGKGLAAVREAILWEVAFAPPACRAKPVRGLILISLNAAAGPAKLAIGTGEWRWSDLLALHSAAQDEVRPRR